MRIFGLIEAHRTARAAYLVALAEQNRLDQIGDQSADWVGSAKQCARVALSRLVVRAKSLRPMRRISVPSQRIRFARPPQADARSLSLVALVRLTSALSFLSLS